MQFLIVVPFLSHLHRIREPIVISNRSMSDLSAFHYDSVTIVSNVDSFNPAP